MRWGPPQAPFHPLSQSDAGGTIPKLVSSSSIPVVDEFLSSDSDGCRWLQQMAGTRFFHLTLYARDEGLLA